MQDIKNNNKRKYEEISQTENTIEKLKKENESSIRIYKKNKQENLDRELIELMNKINQAIEETKTYDLAGASNIKLSFDVDRYNLDRIRSILKHNNANIIYTLDFATGSYIYKIIIK